ncbi:unnamed protein product [Schistocephalus solidus]|uniref:Uncharacterized protein n=1 Tax=Schistocephalus solidus TaxID=70667 RepID=A0A183TJM5_SCHSO|nr:unnamed protein product [Schistocephalus solidus]
MADSRRQMQQKCLLSLLLGMGCFSNGTGKSTVLDLPFNSDLHADLPPRIEPFGQTPSKRGCPYLQWSFSDTVRSADYVDILSR